LNRNTLFFFLFLVTLGLHIFILWYGIKAVRAMSRNSKSDYHSREFPLLRHSRVNSGGPLRVPSCLRLNSGRREPSTCTGIMPSVGWVGGGGFCRRRSLFDVHDRDEQGKCQTTKMYPLCQPTQCRRNQASQPSRVLHWNIPKDCIMIMER
jgi:hypothetical protein